MFDSKQTLTTRLADATDLLIDFATLGEYGLEPAGSTRQGCVDARQRPMPISDRKTFTEVLFPNRCNKASPTSTSTPQRFSAAPASRERRSEPHSEIPRSAPEFGAEARRLRGKRSVVGARRRVAALRKPGDGGVARRYPGAAARAKLRRGPLKKEPAATYSPRGLPPKYHRR